MIINHGIPKHNFFCIALPEESESKFDRINNNQVIKLKDPKSNELFKAEIHDIWKFPIHFLPDGLTKLVYGITGEQLRNVMLKKYPEFQKTTNVEYLLLKKL